MWVGFFVRDIPGAVWTCIRWISAFLSEASVGVFLIIDFTFFFLLPTLFFLIKRQNF